MADSYANEFSEIPAALVSNVGLRDAVLALVKKEPMPGKATEGGTRLDDFRKLLTECIEGHLSVAQAIAEIERRLPAEESCHVTNKRVFSSGWAERLFRTQYSRMYNQAVLEQLLHLGHTECIVPHSRAEGPESPCSLALAGNRHSIKRLHERLVAAYRDGDFSNRDAKLPDHPHCTHVARPLA